MTTPSAISSVRPGGAAPTRGDLPALLPWALGFIAGIVLDNEIPISPVLILAVLLLTSATMLIRRARARGALILAGVAASACGALLHHRAFQLVAGDDIAQFTEPQQRLARVTGRVIGDPRTGSAGYAPFQPWLYQHSRTSFLLEVDGVEATTGMTGASGRLRVTVKEATLRVTDGARVEVFGWLYRLRGPRNPGSFDWALFQQRRGVRASMVCDRAECVQILERRGNQPWWSRAYWRERARRLLLDDRVAYGGPEVSLLDALVMGRRSQMDRAVEKAFVDTGCAHYLAVSGTHMVMLAGAMWWPARVLGWSRRRAAWLVMGVCVAYTLLVDPNPPVLRSTVMVCVYGAGVALRRPRALVGSLCLAAIIVLAADPAALFDLGFQLSFVAVAGILALPPVFAGWLTAAAAWVRRVALREHPVSAEIERIAALHAENTRGRRLTHAGVAAIAVALAAWSSSLPIVAAGFGYLAVWGWLNSLIAAPFVAAVMLLGFLRLAAGALAPPVGQVLDPLLDAAVDVLVGLLSVLADLPYVSVAVAPPPWWLTASYYLLLGALAVRVRRWTGRWAVAGSAALLAITGCAWVLQTNRPDGLRLTQLAVGRGTSTVIELPDGGVWLYDAGASGSYDPGVNIIVPFLHHQGIRHLDGIVLSHANLDHFGGLPTVLDAVSCGPIYLAPSFEAGCTEDMPCAVLLAQLRQRRHPLVHVSAGDELPLGAGVRAEALWPPARIAAGMDVNDASLVVRITVGERAALLTGDIGSAAQEALIARGGLSADVLVLPHHGAVEPSTPAFLAAVGASALVRSSFVPMAESESLQAAVGETPLYNTADLGAVEVLLGSRTVRVRGLGPDRAGPAESEE